MVVFFDFKSMGVLYIHSSQVSYYGEHSKNFKGRLMAMTHPRKTLISLEDTTYYHCVTRCVRRAFLCGLDPFSGKSYEHRRQWIEERLQILVDVFAIDVAAFSIMSNHTHLVLHVDHEAAKVWTEDEVLTRWGMLFRGNALLQKKLQNTQLIETEESKLAELAEIWRERLYDISWFMRCLNEPIARQANEEDNCTGRFWEGRFKSQALLDEAALAACLAYVDLNPIRAKMADTPETSDYTSIKNRLSAVQNTDSANAAKQPDSLLPFAGNPRKDMPKGLPFRLEDYLELVVVLQAIGVFTVTTVGRTPGWFYIGNLPRFRAQNP